VGSTHHVEGDVVLCKNGFHFSPEPLMCLLHAKTPADGFRLMVVEADAADVVRSDCGTKYAARTLRVVDEVADADANAALTGTIVQGVERRSHKSGRLHQTSDDAPALQVATTDVTVWTWYQNGMCSRCDGNPNLPTRVVRFIHNGNAGVNQYYWLDGDGAIFRADGPAYLRLVGDTILEAQWASPSDDDGVANIRFEPTINIVHVNYRDTSAYSSLQLHVYGGGSAAVVEWRDVDTARKKTATLEVRDNGDVTLYRAADRRTLDGAPRQLPTTSGRHFRHVRRIGRRRSLRNKKYFPTACRHVSGPGYKVAHACVWLVAQKNGGQGIHTAGASVESTVCQQVSPGSQASVVASVHPPSRVLRPIRSRTAAAARAPLRLVLDAAVPGRRRFGRRPPAACLRQRAAVVALDRPGLQRALARHDV
jgi:hypothetical protein